jgi:type IV/VI secretion system ImpK/VasF family protein
MRNTTLSSLNQLKNNLRQTLDDHSVTLIFFALVVMLDEEIQNILSSQKSGQWSPLQQDLFNTTNGGEIFFENLDELLENHQVHSFVHEVYYFVLKKGFRGKYAKSPNRITKYLEFLAERLPTVTLELNNKTAATAFPLIRTKFKTWHYYAAAAAILICFYIGMNIHSNM